MHKNFLTSLFFLILTVVMIFSAWAEETTPSALEELFFTEISVASKKSESIGEAAGTISIITAERLKNLRVTNLYEVLAYLPDTTVNETYWREPIVTIRGVMESLYNDKVLLLIDGIPVFEAVNGASYFEQIPIAAIERLEIVRGPGSVLYGTNAFAGVINVVPKKGGQLKGLSGNVSGGSFGRCTLMGSYGDEISSLDDVDVFISGTFSNDKGYPKTFAYDERTTTFNGEDTYTYNYENDLANLYAAIAYKDLKVFGNYWHQKQIKFGMIPVLGYGGLAEHTGANFGAKFVHAFNDAVSYTASGRFTWMERITRVGYHDDEIVPGWSSGFIAFGDHSLYKGSVYSFDNYAVLSPLKDLNLTVGASYERYLATNLYTMLINGSINEASQGSATFPPPTADNWAAYTEGNYTFTENLDATVGVRYSNLGSDIGMFLSPRAGIVFKYYQNNRIKLLYGDAFRMPSIYERFVLVPGVLVGYSDLKAEKVRTFESAVDYLVGEIISTKITGFYSRITDSIIRGPHPVHKITYANSPDIQLNYGAELEIEGGLPDLKCFANLSYKEAIYEESRLPVPYIEKFLMNLGVVYKPWAPLAIKPNVQYIGKREGNLGSGAKAWVGAPGDPVDISPYALVNLDVSYDWMKNATVYLGVKNLFDKKYYYPEHLRKSIDVIPGGPGLEVYAGLTYDFTFKP